MQILVKTIPRAAKHRKKYSHVVEWRDGEKRMRRYVTSAADANSLKERIKEEHRGRLDSDAPLSVPEWEAVRAARRAGLDLAEAVRAALVMARTARPGLTVAQFCEERRGELDGAGFSDKHRSAVAAECDRLVRICGDLPLVMVTAAHVLQAMEERHRGRTPGISGRKARRRDLHALLELAKRRGLIAENPAAKVEAPRASREAIESAAVNVFSPVAARELLEAVRDVAPAILPAVAIGMYAGLRTEELKRLEWAQVFTGRKIIEVRAAVAKTRARRIVEMQPALAFVLEQTAGVEGRVWPANGERLLDAAKRVAGYQGRKHWTPGGGESAGKAWPHNGLRDSFVSYHYAQFKSAALTAAQSGHSEGVLFRHYREVVAPEDAAAFWALRFDAPGWKEAVERAAIAAAERRANKWRTTNYPKERKRVISDP